LDDIYYIEYVADPLEDDNDFELLLFSLLSPDGIFTAQVGDAPSLNTAEAGNSDMKGRFDFSNGLRENGFLRIVNYEEGHLGFSYPWQFVMAFKNNEPKMAWDYTASSWHDLHIDQRILPTPAGDSSLMHFDGAVMQGYSYPSKANEVVYCRTYPNFASCTKGRGLEVEQPFTA